MVVFAEIFERAFSGEVACLLKYYCGYQICYSSGMLPICRQMAMIYPCIIEASKVFLSLQLYWAVPSYLVASCILFKTYIE